MFRYGSLVPSTKWGKIVTMIYAVCGIPVYILYFMNMGKVGECVKTSKTLFGFKVLANLFKWMYRKIYYCAVRRQRARYEMMETDPELENGPRMTQEEEVLIPSTACLWVMLFYLSMGTVMFAEWEQWDYLDSAYFCVTSLLKVKKTMKSILFYVRHVLFANMLILSSSFSFTNFLIFNSDKLLE